MRSKAFESSINKAIVVRHLSKPNVTKFKRSERTGLVECFVLKPSTLCCSKNYVSPDNISFSSNLDIKGNKN